MREAIQIAGNAVVIISTISFFALVWKVQHKGKSRTQQLRDVAGRYTTQGYQLRPTYDGRWI